MIRATKLRIAREIIEETIVDALEAADNCGKHCDPCIASACKSGARTKAQKLTDLRNKMTELIEQIETGHFDLEEDCHAK